MAEKNLKFIFRMTHSYDGKLKCMIKNLRSVYHLAPGAIRLAQGNFSAPMHSQTDILTFESPKQKSWLFFKS